MYEYKAKLARVIDGDTVRLDIDLGFNTWIHNEDVRLLGVDTPEKRTRDKLEKHFGYLATDFVINKLSTLTTLRIKTQLDGAGKFGRTLADIYIDDEPISLNQQLVENHLGVAYHGQNKSKIREAHEANWRYLIENNLTTLPTELTPLYEQITRG